MKVIEKIIIRDTNDGSKTEILGPTHPLINSINSTIDDPIKFHNQFLSCCLSTFGKPFFLEEIIYKNS